MEHVEYLAGIISSHWPPILLYLNLPFTLTIAIILVKYKLMILQLTLIIKIPDPQGDSLC